MNRKLGKLLRPGMGMYFVVMAAFCAAALLERYFWLAAAETADSCPVMQPNTSERSSSTVKKKGIAIKVSPQYTICT